MRGGGLGARRLRDVVGTAAQYDTAGMSTRTQASWKTPTMPVGPSQVDCSSLSRSTRSGSVAVPETGIGRVCGVSASSAPSVTTIAPPSSSHAESSSAQNWRHRMLGSMPRISTTSRSSSGGDATAMLVVGQVIRGSPPVGPHDGPVDLES